MKIFKSIAGVLALGVMMIGATNVFAQGGVAPSSQLGIGVSTAGAQIQYAISPGFHIGSNLGLNVTSPAVGDGVTTIIIEPYARFLFEGVVNPFLQAGISIQSASSTTNTGLFVWGGLEYFITRNVGLWGGLQILNLPFEDGSTKLFGVTQRGAAGVEWFFNP